MSRTLPIGMGGKESLVLPAKLSPDSGPKKDPCPQPTDLISKQKL